MPATGTVKAGGSRRCLLRALGADYRRCSSAEKLTGAGRRPQTGRAGRQAIVVLVNPVAAGLSAESVGESYGIRLTGIFRTERGLVIEMWTGRSPERKGPPSET